MVIHGIDAINLALFDDKITLNKHADPMEGEMVDISIEDAYDLVEDDPSLVWCDDGID
jgi:hypothetical protein